jgi:hypothetical protein
MYSKCITEFYDAVMARHDVLSRRTDDEDDEDAEEEE